MDWIHCNKCFSQLEPGITLHLTSCGHMFCNNCLNNGAKETTCTVCRMPCSTMKLVPEMNPEVQEYFTEPEELIKKCCEVLQFQRQHRRRLLSYLLQSTKKFYTARTELKRMSELCQKQYAKLKEYQKVIKGLEAQINQTGTSKQVSPFNIPISPGDNISPSFIQTTPTYKRPAKSTPYSGYQSNLVTPTRVSKQRSGGFSNSQRSNTSNRISSTVFTPPTPESAGDQSSNPINVFITWSSSSCVRIYHLRSFKSKYNDESGYQSNYSPANGIIYCNGLSPKCPLRNGVKIKKFNLV